jgi:hypothetical protein
MGFKLKGRTMFPALVSVTSPLTLVKNGLQYTFGVDPSQGAVGPSGPGYGGTSTTSLAIGTGTKSFTTQSGYAYQPGNYIRASSAADGTNFMEGTITSYVNTALVLNVTKTGGSGTKTDWTFSLAGTPGANGAGSGDMLAANNLSDVGNKKTSLDNLSVHGADIASAATINLETSTGDLVDVTGTVAITAITLNDGHERTVRFTGILTLTNGASLVLPGGANITTAAGDFAVFRGYAAGVVRCVAYERIAGTPLSTITGLAALVAAFLAAPSSANLIAALTDETGSGSAVFGTSPTITTPNIVGVTNASSASAGSVGELVEAEVTYASRFALVSGTLTTVLTISVAAGDWDFSGVIGFETTGGGVASEFHIEISTTAPPTVVTAPNKGGTNGTHVTYLANQGEVFSVGPRQVNVNAPTTVYLKCLSTFTNSQTVYGYLRGRRMR